MANDVVITVKGKDETGPAAKSAEKNVNGLTQALRGVGGVAAGIQVSDMLTATGEAAKKLIVDTGRAASALQQAVGGTAAVFGDASDAIDEFGKQSADSVGLSERAFRDMTTMVGGQLKRMTGDVNLAGEASIELTKAGADLAATYGGTTAQAMEAFSAALRGEADPAERFNLNLKVSVVQAKAVEMGLAKTTDQVNDAAYAQAFLALVTEQSADAHGQFAREADSAAVAQQKANASWEDAQAKLGAVLLPIMAEAANMAANLAQALGELPAPLQVTIVAVAGVGAAALIVIPKVVALKAAMTELNITAATTGKALKGVGSFLTGPWGVAIGLAVGAIAIFAAEQQKTKERVRELAESLDKQTGAITDNTRAIVVDRLEKEGWLKYADQMGISVALLTDAALGDAEAMEYMRSALERLASTAAEVSKPGIEGNVDALRGMGKELEEARESSKRKTAAMGQDTRATKDNTEAVDDNVSALQKQADELRKMSDPIFRYRDAVLEVAERQRTLNEAIKKHGKNSQEAKDASWDLAESMVGVQDAQADAATAMNGKLDPALKKILKDAGVSASEIARMEKKLRDAKRAADALDGKTVRVQVRYTESGAHYQGEGGGGTQVRAAGGPTWGWTTVGEYGRELVKLPTGSMVYPHGQSESMMAGIGGGAAAVNINIGSGGGPDSLAELFLYLVRTGRIVLQADLDRGGRVKVAA